MCKTYYVDPQTGRDTNDGLTPEKPLATLFAVNRLALAPGDTVLLKGGSVFEKQFLHLRCCGEKNCPITIAAYGEGSAPRIDADGQGLWYQDYGCALDSPTHVYRGYVSSAVLLYDAAYVTVRDLELTNRADAVIGEQYSQPDKLERTGVAVVAKDRGTRCGITLQNLLIHDVHGNVYDKHMNNGGIYMTALQPADETATGAARFADVLVEGCYVARVSRWGIAVGYTYAHAQFQGAELAEKTFLQYGHENVVLRDNYVKAAGGDGLTVMYALRPLVEHNTADSGDGTVYEHNYSRMNEGGCVMFCLEEAIHNTFRGNVSYDDLGGTISPSQNPDALLEHNTFYLRDGVPFVRARMDGGSYTEKDDTILPLP